MNVAPAGYQWPDLRPIERRAVLDGLVTICLLAGSAHSTAYLVAAEFAHGCEAPAERPRSWPSQYARTRAAKS